MSFLVVKVGGAVSGQSADAVLELAVENDVLVVHGAGPQISAEMERAGVPVRFVDGLRVTPPEGIAIVRASYMAVNEALCAAIGERAVGLAGDEIGLAGKPLPRARVERRGHAERAARGARGARRGEDPGARARGPERNGLAERQRRRRGRRDRDRHGRRQARLPHRCRRLHDRRPGGRFGRRRRGREAARRQHPRGGIIPKLGSAVDATRHGIEATIGRTAVVA